MAWSDKQRKMVLIACGAAGIDDAHRYTVMRYAGCQKHRPEGRPTLTHPRNDQRQFELVMAVLESIAVAAGAAAKFPRCRNASSWREAADRPRQRLVVLANKIADEATSHVPWKFPPFFLSGFVKRMTMNDGQVGQEGIGPRDALKECDAQQLHRIVEGLKAWVGREFMEKGIEPRSFKPHAGARDRRIVA